MFLFFSETRQTVLFDQERGGAAQVGAGPLQPGLHARAGAGLQAGLLPGQATLRPGQAGFRGRLHAGHHRAGQDWRAVGV